MNAPWIEKKLCRDKCKTKAYEINTINIETGQVKKDNEDNRQIDR